MKRSSAKGNLFNLVNSFLLSNVLTPTQNCIMIRDGFCPLDEMHMFQIEELFQMLKEDKI